VAKKLTAIGEQEEVYWTRANLSDAIALAKQNLADSRKVASSAESGNLGEARQAFENLNRSCSACHDLHPEKRLAVEK